MIVLVDIGNSFTKVATAEEGRLTSNARLASRHETTPDELYVELKTLDIANPRDAVICSVVPDITEKYITMFRNRMNVGHPLIVSPYIHTGVELNYRNLSNLGADRIANVVGAHFEYGKDLAVVDFGTATTIDFVTGEGQYLGGIIAPGMEKSLSHLITSTSRLLDIKPVKPTHFVGRSTEECLQAGFYLLTVGLIEATRAAVRRETKMNFTFVATGGLAERLAGFASAIEIIDRDLTLKGCLHLYRLNKSHDEKNRGEEKT